MKVGDLVRPRRGRLVGIIVKRITSEARLEAELPDALVVLWDDGEFTEEWADELEMIDASW